jgi:EAL domain-containing protein (putative c-di-GMP-specific phosphodiesterase class I)
VNICGPHFTAFSLPQSVQKSVNLSGLSPSTLILECPEREIARYIDRASNIMEVITKMGVQWAVDDFDGEDRFLSVVPRLPVSFLKLNHKILADAQQGDGPARHAQSLSRAPRPGLEFGGQGCREPGTVGVGESLGIGYVQGFYFSKPLDESAAWGLLTANPSW